MCFVNGNLIGDEKGLKAWAKDMWDYTDYRPLPLYKALAEDFYVKYMRGTKVSESRQMHCHAKNYHHCACALA